MALIKCPECGKQISERATNCPNCGFPIQQKPKPAIMNDNPTKAPVKINNRKIARIFVFDNCNTSIIKKAFQLVGERLGKEAHPDYSKTVLIIELEKWVNLMYYQSAAFKSNRTFASLYQVAKIEGELTDIQLPPLDRVAELFIDTVKEVDSSTVLFEETGYIDITKSYDKAHYQHIYDKEAALLISDRDNVSAPEEAANNRERAQNPSQKEKRKRGGDKKEAISAGNGRVWRWLGLIASLVVIAYYVYYCSGGGRHGNGQKTNNICPICHQSMEGKYTVQAHTIDGRTITVCAGCYTVGKAGGYCY